MQPVPILNLSENIEPQQSPKSNPEASGTTGPTSDVGATDPHNLDSRRLNYIDDKSRRPTFRQKGTTYVVRNIDSNQDNEDIYHVMDDLYEDVITQSKMADFQANVYKLLNVFACIFIVIAGAIIGILSINTDTINNISNITDSNQNKPTILTMSVLGFGITVIKTLLVLFSIEKRSILLKESGIKLRKLSREIKNLKTLNLSNTELFHRIDMINTEIDELDIHMFKNDNHTSDKSNPTDTVVNL